MNLWASFEEVSKFVSDSCCMNPLKRTARALFVPLFGLSIGLSVLAGCGSSSADTTAADVSVAATATNTEATDTANDTTAGSKADAKSTASASDADAFTDCLKAQGVELPDGFAPGGAGAGGAGLGQSGAPASLPEGVDLAAMQTALAACQDKLPAGAALPGGGPGAAAGGADFSAYTTCLKDNGIAIPEPFDPSKLDMSDPAFADAATTCKPLLPAAFQGLAPASPPTTVGA